MDWQLFYILFTINLAVATSGLAYFAWKRRHRKGARAFTVLMITVAASSLPYAAELASNTLSQMILWSKVGYVGLTAIPITWLAFAFSYTDNRRWLTQENFFRLSIVPLATLILVMTNEQHGLIWEQTRIEQTDTLSTFDPVYGFWFWVHMSYTYLILAFGSLLLLRKALNTWSLYRRQSIAIFLGTLFPWIGNFILVFDLSPLPELNPIPISFNLGCICFAWAVFRLSMLDIVPVSYEDVIESLPDGVMTIDVNNRVTAVNSVIQPYLNHEPDQIIAQAIEDVFAHIPPDFKHLYRARDARTEIETNEGSIEIRVSPLYNRRKQFMGRLLLFRDITHQKRAEVALKQRLEHLSIIREAYEEIGSSLNLDKILPLAVDAAMRLSKSQAGYLALLDQDELQIAASSGYGDSSTHKLILKADSTVLQRVISTHKAQLLHNVILEPGYSPFLFDTKAKMVVPLISQNALIGLINVETPHPNHYAIEIFDFVQILASRIAASIDSAHLHHSLQNRLGEVHQLYKKVSQLEQLKTDMIRIAAHDIRNPLMAIAGSLEMILDEGIEENLQLYI
ncbi:MAG: GAF domain-containing protein, partial [Anaerolineae bacterium]|nr:GAF domain-containing protein [Anaerolineae bacterium]